jgi:uncharacterized phage infection (PIP) family protein YhgE
MIKIDKKKSYILIAGIVFIVGLIAWNVLSGSNISNNGNGADTVRKELGSVSDKQQSVAKRLDTIETGLSDSAAKAGTISEGLGSITKTVTNAENRISNSETRAQSSAELISKSQSILARVRERGKTGN